MVELILTQPGRDAQGMLVFDEAARCWVRGTEIFVLVGHPHWADALANITVFDLETGLSMSLGEDGEEWAINLPQAFRSGQLVCHAARIGTTE